MVCTAFVVGRGGKKAHAKEAAAERMLSRLGQPWTPQPWLRQYADATDAGSAVGVDEPIALL